MIDCADIKKAAIYHFTDHSDERPKIYQDQLMRLMEFAESKGFVVSEIFCDKSLLRCERPEFDRLLTESDQFDAIFVKDFYHISKNTMKCIQVMRDIAAHGVMIYTMDNGCFEWKDVPFTKKLKVASYCCRFGSQNELLDIISTQNDILKLFAKKKTNWLIVDQYSDESKTQNNGEQKQLMDLRKNKDKYDLMLVHNLNDIHWRTSNFCKIREELKLDIYSLQDGFLKY